MPAWRAATQIVGGRISTGAPAEALRPLFNGRTCSSALIVRRHAKERWCWQAISPVSNKDRPDLALVDVYFYATPGERGI